MNTGMLDAGSRVTFKGLFGRHALVEIPIVQRDYAQGRASEQEVREEFLSALCTALLKPQDDGTLPLDLDFVYGSAELSGRAVFSPLDGQQRLTTLFLLHWYLAWKDGEWDDLAAFIRTGNRSRFTYAVRPSSREFFDALVCWNPLQGLSQIDRVSDAIVDEPWFFRSWKLDPTIQSALAMLDAIHRRFVGTSGCYARLVHASHPAITIQLLELKNFGLSDDLYIKMNARGKPLTGFETFKARLEGHIGLKFAEQDRILHGQPATLKEYFSHRIDTLWADLFWHYRDHATNLFDDRFMHLVRAVVIVTRDPDTKGDTALLHALRDPSEVFSFLRYQQADCLDRPFLDTLVTALDAWSGSGDDIRMRLDDSSYYDERLVFGKAVRDSTQLTYAELIQFHAYTGYIRRYGRAIDPGRITEWMRIVVNLSDNTPLDNIGDLLRGLRGINQLLDHAPDVMQYFAGVSVETTGFNEQQIREEQLKAQLITRSGEWQSRILAAERHRYFAGQIEFLFKFTGMLDRWVANRAADWSEDADAEYQASFAVYLSKASSVFSEKGLVDFGEKRWERALLATGNYLLFSGRNMHFGESFGRDTSWKRLLRGSAEGTGDWERRRLLVKALLDKIDTVTGVGPSLSVVISGTPATGDWREPFIRCPALLQYCRSNMIRFHSRERIYLLRKQRMSGEHAEAGTYYLSKTLLRDMEEWGELAPFSRHSYRTVSTDTEEPCAVVSGVVGDVTVSLLILNTDNGLNLKLAFGNQEEAGPITERLTAGGVLAATEHGGMAVTTTHGGIREAILAVCSALREAQGR